MQTVSDAALYTEYQRVRAQYASKSAACRAVGLKLGVNEHSARRRITAIERRPQLPVPVSRKIVPLPSWQTYVYTGQLPRQAIPLFTGVTNDTFDEAMIAGDIHIPSTKLGFLQRMCKVAERHMRGERILYIIGDLHNGDKDSKHAEYIPRLSRATELDMVGEVLQYLLGYFDIIRMTPGNHTRNRIFATLDGDITMDQVKRLILPSREDHDRLHISPYDTVLASSGGTEWAMHHQYQYRQNKLSIANDLAQKYLRNTIVFHQHHTAIGRDKYNRFTIVDCGGFHDSDMMSYTSIVPNTMPVMCNAFTYLQQGTAHLFTPYPTMTKWSDWLPDEQVLKAA